MACKFEITIPSELSEQVDLATAALDTVDIIEDELTIFRPGSELSRVNREAFERPVVVDESLFELLRRCQALHRETAAPSTSPPPRCPGPGAS